MDQSSSASADSDVPLLKHLECRDGGGDQRSQFMRDPSMVDFLLAAELSHSARDGIVEASIQRPKVVGPNGRAQFKRQIGDRLTNVTVVVNDLPNAETLEQEIAAVLDGAAADRLSGRGTVDQLLDELIKEQRHASLEFRFGRRGIHSTGNLGPATSDDLVTIHTNKGFEGCAPHGLDPTGDRLGDSVQ
jgi:hypothetical protein